jgi:DNA-binding NarL/FixJ family response regulator
MDDLDVAIIGECQFNNQLLQNFIESRLKLRCGCKNTSTVSFLAEGSPLKSCLLLCDCLGLDSDEIRTQFAHCFSEELAPCKVIFFNLEPVADLECEAMAHGVKGIFYIKDTLDKLERGIQSVLNDELWFSRANISKYLNCSQQLAKNEAGENLALSLTSRERQILQLLTTGANNQRIAEKLFISPHTVKTHLNNVFGKIKVTDRIQALLWAAKNL